MIASPIIYSLDLEDTNRLLRILLKLSMRLSSSNKIAAKKVVPVSNRSPSPDLSTKHLLRQTEPIDFTLADKKRK